MKVTVTEETRRRAQQMIEEVSRGFIDDSDIAFPDDEDLAAMKREAAERRRAAKRRPAASTADSAEAHSAG